MMGVGAGLEIGWLLMAFLWIALIALAVWLIRVLFPYAGLSSRSSAGPELSLSQYLDRTYARGEISRRQYERIKAALADDNRPGRD